MSGYSQMSAAECPLDSCKDKEKGGVGGALLNSKSKVILFKRMRQYTATVSGGTKQLDQV